MENSTHSVSIGLIEAALNSSFGAALGVGNNTHEPALRYIAQLVQQTQNEALVAAIVAARLPEDYSGNTSTEIPKMIESAIEKGFDQSEQKSDAKDSKQSSEALTALKTSGMSLFHDDLGKTYATFDGHVGGSVVVPIASSEMKRRIQHAFYKAQGKAISGSGLTEVVDTLSAQAHFDGAMTEIHLRLGAFEDQAFIDRGG